jgi:hypothetical protein
MMIMMIMMAVVVVVLLQFNYSFWRFSVLLVGKCRSLFVPMP